MRLAADLESTTEKHAVTPGELLPAVELLGDLFMEINKPEEAITHYELLVNLSSDAEIPIERREKALTYLDH